MDVIIIREIIFLQVTFVTHKYDDVHIVVQQEKREFNLPIKFINTLMQLFE